MHSFINKGEMLSVKSSEFFSHEAYRESDNFEK